MTVARQDNGVTLERDSSFLAHLADAHAGHASHLEIRLKNTRCDLRSTVIMTTRESFKFMFDPSLSRQSDRFHFTGKAAEAPNENVPHLCGDVDELGGGDESSRLHW